MPNRAIVFRGTTVLAMTVVFCGTPAAGQRGVGAPRVAVRAATPVKALQARLEGTVITRDEPPKPVSLATVRVRSLIGRVIGMTTTDQSGAFSFTLDEAGSYYVELVDDAGRVLAVEDVGEATVTVGPGHTSTTILRVPARRPSGPWGSTAKTMLGAAAAAGIGAFAASGQPASPER